MRDAIRGAAELSGSGLSLRLWEKLNIVGFKLDNLIRDSIGDAEILVADVTYPNANVYYEIGYATAIGKPVLPTVNTAIAKAVQGVQRTGLFDTIGWATYCNAEELREKLQHWSNAAWSTSYVRRRNYGQPMFILDTLVKTDFRNHIFHAVENSHVQFRTYDPAEVPRLTAAQAIADVSASAGVIVPIIADDIVDSDLHNLRGSFVLGLCHGFQVEALAIQYEHFPAPLDYRDFITNSTFKGETERHVEEFAAKVLIWNQKASSRDNRLTPGLLGEIDIGSPVAENETQSLNYYFVETAEFARALRSEGAVVVGRKGSGKSAVFLQIAQRALRNKRTCVVDLRPASHNLSEMRESILSVVSSGVFDHTVAAFWQYLMYVEVILKLRELALPRSRNDFAIQQRIRAVEEACALTESVVSGDFTSRLETAVREVIRKIDNIDSAADVRSQITNLLFEEPIPRLRDIVVSFSDFADEIVVLIDDLDKGWPPRQVEAHDVGMIKHLIEVLNRMQRDLTRRRIGFKHLLFLRSDIYERLVEHTSDRGKYNVIKVDWSDPEQLRYLLRQRVISRLDPINHEAAWDGIDPHLGKGKDAIDLMIDTSLRRPRLLIDVCERTLSFAVNRGHAVVTADDVEQALRQMSLYLVSDFGYEMRDVAGTPEDIFYAFIGASDLLTQDEIAAKLSGIGLGERTSEIVELLLWYGFLGIVGSGDETAFIYDRAYDFRRLQAELGKEASERLYAVNPAFLMGLDRTQHVTKGN